MAAQRIAINTPATITATFYPAGSEVATDPGGTTVTVTIVRADGTAVVTSAATTRLSAGIYQYSLPAQTQLNYLTAVWTGPSGQQVTTFHEIVGGFLAELAEIRALDGLSDTVKYPTQTLIDARDKARDLVEDVTKVAWTPRYARETLSGYGNAFVPVRMMARQLLSVSIGGVAQTDLTQFILYSYGRIERVNSIFPIGGTNNVIVEYIHGFDAPPADLKQAFLRLVRHYVLKGTTRIDERATTLSNDMGTMTLTVANDAADRHTGLPEVDAVLNRYDFRVPLIMTNETTTPGYRDTSALGYRWGP